MLMPHDAHMVADLGFEIRTILVIFELQVTQMLPTKFQVNLPFGSGEEAKNRFSRLPWWISNRNDFSYILSTSHTEDASYQVSSQLRSHHPHPHPDVSYQVSSQLVFWLSRRSKQKKRFSRWQPWWPSWISDRNNFSYFWSISHWKLLTKFPVKWLFVSEEAKNKFSRWPPSWISDWKDFSYFWSTKHPDAFYQVKSQLAFGLRSRIGPEVKEE